MHADAAACAKAEEEVGRYLTLNAEERLRHIKVKDALFLSPAPSQVCVSFCTAIRSALACGSENCKSADLVLGNSIFLLSPLCCKGLGLLSGQAALASSCSAGSLD